MYCVYVSWVNEAGTSSKGNPRKGSSGTAGVRLWKKQFQIVSADTSFYAMLIKFTASNVEIEQATSVTMLFCLLQLSTQFSATFNGGSSV